MAEPSAAHRRDPDDPGWCVCNREVVFFEDGDDDGVTGYGCSRNRLVWKDIIEQMWNQWLPPHGWRDRVNVELHDSIDDALFERGPEYLHRS